MFKNVIGQTSIRASVLDPCITVLFEAYRSNAMLYIRQFLLIFREAIRPNHTQKYINMVLITV